MSNIIPDDDQVVTKAPQVSQVIIEHSAAKIINPWSFELVIIVLLALLIAVLFSFIFWTVCRYIYYINHQNSMSHRHPVGVLVYSPSNETMSRQTDRSQDINVDGSNFTPLANGQIILLRKPGEPSEIYEPGSFVPTVTGRSLSTKSLSTTTPILQQSKATLRMLSSRGPSSTLARLNVSSNTFISNLMHWRRGRPGAISPLTKGQPTTKPLVYNKFDPQIKPAVNVNPVVSAPAPDQTEKPVQHIAKTVTSETRNKSPSSSKSKDNDENGTQATLRSSPPRKIDIKRKHKPKITKFKGKKMIGRIGKLK